MSRPIKLAQFVDEESGPDICVWLLSGGHVRIGASEPDYFEFTREEWDRIVNAIRVEVGDDV